jgi:hypothetical protein
MSRRRCCGAGDNPPEISCPAKPSGFDAREYQLNLPELRPMQLGRVIPGNPVDPLDQGIFAGNATHPGWSISYCDYHTTPYIYYEKQQISSGCGTGNNFWHYADGPGTQYMPSFGMIFDGVDLLPTGFGPSTMVKNFGTTTSSPNAYWTLRVFMERCRFNGCTSIPYTNRTYLQLLFRTRSTYQIRLCEPGPGTPIVARNHNNDYMAEYWTDPWTTSDGIGETFYLKALTHSNAMYFPCDIAEGVWEKSVCLKSYEKGTLTSYPINIVPTEITMDRLS